jgi:LacI family transcriptional regulator
MIKYKDKDSEGGSSMGKEKAKLTITDIAEMAGVSKATVSRVINKTKPVSSEVRQRVMQVIKETGYKPSFVARSLINKETNIIGVVVPDISNEFCSQLVQGVVDVANIYNYTMILCNTFSDYQREEDFLEVLSEKEVDGIIFVTYSASDYHKEFFDSYEKPVVTVNAKIQDVRHPNVDIDNEMAAYEGVRYLMDLGHEKIAMIGVDNADYATGYLRKKGYKKALEDNDVEYNEDYYKEANYSAELAREKIKELLELEEVPTAVFCASDEMAAGAIGYCLENGVRVPEDISIMGFDDSKISKLFVPQITTISQPSFDMGAVAMRLIDKIKGKNKLEEMSYQLAHKIIERNSTSKLFK